MDTTRLKVSIGRTYNMGNYESLRLEIGLEEEFGGLIDNEEHFQKLTQDLYVRCEKALRKERDKILKWHEKNA